MFLMKYRKIIPAVFLSRPNRFIARVLIDGKEETVHVKNTGRCKELLREGVTVYLSEGDNPQRKTKYDLVAVEKIRDGKEKLLVNMDSQLPNAVAAEWIKKSGIFSENALIKREVTYGKSRFDIYVEDKERRAFVEVKGVTLEGDGVASFPDAPTERGTKHLNELIECKRNGFEAYILFVIQMKEIHLFTPNFEHDPVFSDTLRKAEKEGVKILAVDCIVTPDEVICDKEVKIKL